MEQYANPNRRKQPTFVALVLSICCLSSRYVQDSRLPQSDASGDTLASRLLTFAKDIVGRLAAERTDLEIVQALFNMSVVQEGHGKAEPHVDVSQPGPLVSPPIPQGSNI